MDSVQELKERLKAINCELSQEYEKIQALQKEYITINRIIINFENAKAKSKKIERKVIFEPRLKTINKICVVCENKPVYARDMCRNCYSKYLRNVVLYSQKNEKGKNEKKTEEDKVLQKRANIRLKFQEQYNFDFDVYDAFSQYRKILTDKQNKVMIEYLIEMKTYDQIGDEINLSKERVRQIVNKSVKLLYNEYQIKHKSETFKGIEKELQNIKKEKRDKEDQIQKKEKAKIQALCMALSDIKTTDMNLSTRALNALGRAGYTNAGEVYLLIRKDELGYIRNLGEKSEEEIKNKIENILKNMEVNNA